MASKSLFVFAFLEVLCPLKNMSLHLYVLSEPRAASQLRPVFDKLGLPGCISVSDILNSLAGV